MQGAKRSAMPGAGWNMPMGLSSGTDELLLTAARVYGAEQEALPALVAHKLELVRQYDVGGMNRAANICHCGGSGSLLLASYLDGHPDIVMLPMLTGTSIYQFFEAYGSLSVWEKLVAYPEYATLKQKSDGHFFLKDNPTGDFAIGRADYYASIHALYAAYGDMPESWLGTRLRFFQFLHIAYGAASGRRVDNPRPLMVYAQHWFDNALAERFIEDFPLGRFLHTIRDPISGIDSWFDRKLEMELYRADYRADLSAQYLDPAVSTSIDLISNDWDRGHRGMRACTRGVRFEDMHLEPEATMRRVAGWLGIGFEPSLLRSTWNGTPYVVKVRGSAWCGSNPNNAKRRWKNLSWADRLMLFALLHDNFTTWNYPSPMADRSRFTRLCIVALLWLVPMKMELINARKVLELQVLPNLRRGRILFACRAPFFLLKRRLRMMLLIAAQAYARLVASRPVMKAV
jgi:hypothetical protein